MERSARRLSRDHRSAAIFRAAAEPSADRGPDEVTIRDIAAQAGLAEPDVRISGTRDADLWEAPISWAIGHYFALCDEALAQAGPGSESRLAALVRATIQFYTRYPVTMSLLRARVVDRGGEVATVGEEASMRGATRRFIEVIQQGVDEGVFRTPYPADARRAIEAAVNAVVEWYDLHGPIGPAELADRYVHLALVLVEYAGPVGAVGPGGAVVPAGPDGA